MSTISVTVQNPAVQASSSSDILSKATVLKLASYLTDPVCKVRESFYTFYILDKICTTTAQKVMKIVTLVLALIVYTVLTPFTAPLGIVLRGLVATFESKPFIYWKRAGEGKKLDTEIAVLLHNVCWMPAGYSITDGQVVPPSHKQRMQDTVNKIKSLNPDIVCLCEVPDILDASELSHKLPDYPFVIPVAGVRAVGPSSMLFVASKYEIAEDSIEFIPFAKGTELTGRAKHSEKGFLSFDLKEKEVTVISTHLQHSEIPAKPQQDAALDEPKARALQMQRIARKIREKVEQGKKVIFMGDLNQDEDELKAFLKEHQVEFLKRDKNVEKVPTWDGDKWCAELMGKQASGPMVLDYTFVAGENVDITTEVLPVGYSGTEFKPDALSDHKMLLSTITV